MALLAEHLAELAEELAPWLRGAPVRDVQALPPRDLLLVFDPEEEGGRVRRLRISADAETGRLHAQVERTRRHTGPEGPFFREARERLVDRKLSGLQALPGDRIVRLDFRGASLVLELVGRHANLILLDGEGLVVRCLVDPSPGSSAAERLAPGARWAAPPGRRAPAASPPSLSETFPPAELPPEAPPLPLSRRVEMHLGGEARSRRADELRDELSRRLSRRRRSAAHLVAGLERRQEAAGEAERTRQDGELLQAARDRLRRGLESIEVEDWFTEGAPKRRIPLDPRLGPGENVERFFSRYRKKLRALERVPAELELARANLEALDELAGRLAEDEADAQALEEEALSRGLLSPRQPPPDRRPKATPRLPYLRFRASRGSEVRVGRSARDNDRLTFREARGSDLWLHTADAPGSHVVLRTGKGVEPDPEEILDAAHLAVYFSPLRGARRADVHVARCKEVKKPRRAPAGLVTLSGGRTLALRLEEERLERLLATRRGEES